MSDTTRVTACAWCAGEIVVTRPWRWDEYQIHAECLPLLDAFQARLWRIFEPEPAA